MRRTVFDTSVLSSLLKRASGPLLSLVGWRKEGRLPEKKRFVLIAAPHTSNWDLVMMLLLAFNFGLKIYWMGKDELFRFPFGGLMRWLGGIPIDRSKSHNVVEESMRMFAEHDELVIAVPPEGTRGKVRYWKSGFYYIADGARVPIVLGFLDWRRKVGGMGPAVMPTGNIEADMELIKDFYKNIKGKFEAKFSQASVKNDKARKVS